MTRPPHLNREQAEAYREDMITRPATITTSESTLATLLVMICEHTPEAILMAPDDLSDGASDHARDLAGTIQRMLAALSHDAVRHDIVSTAQQNVERGVAFDQYMEAMLRHLRNPQKGFDRDDNA